MIHNCTRVTEVEFIFPLEKNNTIVNTFSKNKYKVNCQHELMISMLTLV